MIKTQNHIIIYRSLISYLIGIFSKSFTRCHSRENGNLFPIHKDFLDSSLRWNDIINLEKIPLIIAVIIAGLLWIGTPECRCAENDNTLNMEWQGLKIVDIQYKSDIQLPEDRIRSLTDIKIGDPYTKSQIRKSIESIFSIGGFSNIEVDAQPKGDGISLTFLLYNQPRVRSININGGLIQAGNKRLERSEILEILRIREGYEYSESLAQTDVESISELYKQYGYMNANITFTANIDNQTKNVDVSFNISEGGQPIITEIIFTGTNKAIVPPKNLYRLMKDIRLGSAYKGQKMLDLDTKRIEEEYRKKEYLTAKVVNAQALSDPDVIKYYEGIGQPFIAGDIEQSNLKNGSVAILIEIKQGKRVYMKIDGNKHISTKNIKKVVALSRMRSVNESIVRRSRDDIMKLYKTNGFYLVDVNYEILKDDRIWDFNKNEDTEGWEILQPFKQFQVSNGLLEIETGSELQLSGISVYPNIYQKALVRMRVRSDVGKDITYTKGRLYWTTNKSKKWSQKKSQSFYSKVTIDNQFYDYEIRLYENRRWSDTVNQLRLALVDAPDVNVDVEWIKMTTEFIPIVFTIKENKQMRIKNIQIVRSNDKNQTSIVDRTITENDIKKQMLTRKKSFFSFWILKKYFPTGILDEDIFAEDIRAIDALYKSNGYMNPIVEADDPKKTMKPERGEIDIIVKIKEGPRTLVDEVVIEGNKNEVVKPEELFPILNVVDKDSFDPQNITTDGEVLRYKPNKPKDYREYDVVADRSVLSLHYADKGYLAQIETNKQFNADMTKATITYKMTPGNLVKLAGGIEIIGNKRTNRFVIERELSDTLLKDKIFGFSEIENSAQRIRNIGIFESVNLETPQVNGSSDSYRLLINVKEKDAISVNFHVGYNSKDEFQGGIETSDINLWGRAHRTTGKATLGTQGKKVEAEYAIPKVFPGLRHSDVVGLFNIYPYSQYTTQYTENIKDVTYKVNYDELRKGASAGISWSFRSINTLKLDYRYEFLRYNIYSSENEAINEYGKTRIGRLETFIQRDGRDNLLNPRRGTFYGLSLEYANPKLLGVERFTKLSLNTMYYAHLFRNVVLALGLRTGKAWELGGTKRVIPELFKMRDYQTPRGYKWETKDIGDTLVNASTEIRFPIGKLKGFQIGAALFFDSGRAFNGISSFDINLMQSAVGAGLRIITPIGPIRLDYGYPVRGNGKRDYLPSFAFGNPF
jgi:outer membrane protein assembly complex protein YaeT